MSALIDTLNLFGQRFVDFALPMLIQSSLLIAFLLTLDLVLRKHVRAVIRYGLWMLVLIKLVLPPSFASPTGLGYWLPAKQAKQPEQPIIAPAPAQFTVSYSEAEPIYVPSTTPPPILRYTPSLTWPAILLLGWATITIALVIWLVLRARFVTRMSARASDAPESLLELLQSCRQQMDIQQSIRLKFSTEATSPAVCGLWRPTILIPVLLVDKLSTLRMRAVLLHELAHIKRGDLWVNYAQTLLQIFYWYNPLLWLANAIIRRVREQAVDEMVMVEMGQHANAYPTTLLEVAKLTFTRSVLSLGLVGIMESKGALKQRIQTLLSRPIPKLARLGWKGLTCVSLVGLITLPMASHPKANALEPTKPSQPTASIGAASTNLSLGVFIYNTNKFLAELRVQAHLSDPSSRAEEQEALRKLLADAGTELKPPAGMVYRGGAISVDATVTEMEVVKQVLLKLDPGLQLALFPESHSHTNSFGASTGHQTILNKLDSIRLDSVLYDGMPLSEVVKDLNLKAKKHDPDGLGITVFIDTATSAAGGIWYIPITIKPALINVRLVDVLDAIVKVAPQTVSYEVGNSAVAFSASTPAQRLHFRSFWVNTNSFIPALQQLVGQPPTRNMTELLKGFRDFLETLGASLLPPKEISYVDDRQGHLMVRGTSNDLAIVDKALNDFGALGVAPTFVEGVSAPIPRFVPAVVLPTNTAIGDELFRNDLGTSSVGDTKAPAAGQPIRTTNETPMRAKDKVPVLGDFPLIGRFFRPELTTPGDALARDVSIDGPPSGPNPGLDALISKGPRVMPDLAHLLQGTGSQDERIKAADAMGAIAYRNPNAPEVQAAVPTLMSVAQKGDIEVRFRAVQALGAIGQGASNAVPVLIQLTQDTNFSVRMCAVEALGRIGADSPESLAALKVAMNDTSDDVRVTAKHALEILYQTPAIRTNKVYAGRLVQDGRVLYEVGKLDAAEAKLNQALKHDPGNLGANYYLNLIREKRYGIGTNSPIVAKVIVTPIQQPRLIPEAQIRTNILVKAGDVFDRVAVDRDVRNLYGSGLFSNIRAVDKPAGEGLVIINYLLQEKSKLTRIRFKGNSKLGEPALGKSLLSKVGQAFDERTVFTDTQSLQALLRASGYSTAKVKAESNVNEDIGEAEVTFEITE